MTTPDESHDEEFCEDRSDPSSWDDPDIAEAWDEPPVIDPAPEGGSHDAP